MKAILIIIGVITVINMIMCYLALANLVKGATKGPLGLSDCKLFDMAKRPLKRQVWKWGFVGELVFITILIIIAFDCYEVLWSNKLPIVIAAILFVYLLCLINMGLYKDNTKLEKDKIYLFKKYRTLVWNGCQFPQGIVSDDGKAIEVLLVTYKDKLPENLKVRFRSVEGPYITVSLVDDD